MSDQVVLLLKDMDGIEIANALRYRMRLSALNFVFHTIYLS